MVAVIPLTTAPPKSRLQVQLSPSETGLKMTSTVLVDHLKFINCERLRPSVAGRLTPDALEKVERSVSLILGLAE